MADQGRFLETSGLSKADWDRMAWPITPYLPSSPPLARPLLLPCSGPRAESLLQPLPGILPPPLKGLISTQGKRIAPKLALWHHLSLKSQFIASTEVHSQAQERRLDSSGSAPSTIAGSELPYRGPGMTALRIIVTVKFYQPSGAMACSPGPVTKSLIAANSCGQRGAPRTGMGDYLEWKSVRGGPQRDQSEWQSTRIPRPKHLNEYCFHFMYDPQETLDVLSFRKQLA